MILATATTGDMLGAYASYKIGMACLTAVVVLIGLGMVLYFHIKDKHDEKNHPKTLVDPDTGTPVNEQELLAKMYAKKPAEEP
jgi:hypothetical protein